MVSRAALAAALAALALALVAWLTAPRLAPDLRGRVAVVTGGSRGAGYGFLLGLSEAGATVYVTGRQRPALEEACASAPGPGACIPRVVDSADDAAVEAFFAEVASETGGRLDILVNNAYSALSYQRAEGLVGKPFWEQPMRLFDEVHRVGVRAHYRASVLAVPLMQRQGGGLIVNTNSPGCVLYAIGVAYGMGKCAVDKMTADTAMELATEGIDVMSWWPGVPMRSEEILQGAVDGGSPRRGLAPGLQLVPPFRSLYHTALATTLRFEGRALAALARDRAGRTRWSGMAVLSAQLGRRYGLVDERGVCPPSALSVKYQLSLWLPPLQRFAVIPEDSEASPAQMFFFNVLPNVDLPVWLFKLIGGPPLTLQWPIP